MSDSTTTVGPVVVAPPSTPRLLQQRPHRAPRIIKRTTTATTTSAFLVHGTSTGPPIQTASGYYFSLKTSKKCLIYYREGGAKFCLSQRLFVRVRKLPKFVHFQLRLFFTENIS